MNGSSTERRWDSFGDDIRKALQMLDEATTVCEKLAALTILNNLNEHKTLLMHQQLSGLAVKAAPPAAQAAPPAAPPAAAAAVAADQAVQRCAAASKVSFPGGLLISGRIWNALGQVLAAGVKGALCAHASPERQWLLAHHTNKQHVE